MFYALGYGLCFIHWDVVCIYVLGYGLSFVHWDVVDVLYSGTQFVFVHWNTVCVLCLYETWLLFMHWDVIYVYTLGPVLLCLCLYAPPRRAPPPPRPARQPGRAAGPGIPVAMATAAGRCHVPGGEAASRDVWLPPSSFRVDAGRGRRAWVSGAGGGGR